jgi:hypothetical protein
MNWKIFIAPAVSLLAVSIPQNGIGCGPDADPHDYFTSFFSRAAGSEKIDKPFYYTALQNFYDDWDEDSTHGDALLDEWKKYTGIRSSKDAAQLVYTSTQDDVKRLATAIDNGKAPGGNLSSNEMAQALSRQKNRQAINYLLFVKKTESFSKDGGWDATKKDSLQLNRYIAEANDQFTGATDPFIKTRYAFQRCKLSFYNNRFKDCITWCDAWFNEHSDAATAPMALSYKGGSLFRLGRSKEAAYNFSKSFTATEQNRKIIFLGFLWATDHCNPKLENEYSALAANKKEKAGLLGMFGLYGTGYRLSTAQKVYELDPSSPLLQLLVNREVNKLEEQYFTPLLFKEKGGKKLYLSWDENTKELAADREQLNKTSQFLEKLAADRSLAQRGFYAVSAAYLNFMKKDMAKAEAMLATAREAKNSTRVSDQMHLIELLVQSNKEKTLSPVTAEQILPLVNWLEEKARTDAEYRTFLRNFFSELVAQQYEQQGDAQRAALAYGVSDLGFLNKKEYDYQPEDALYHLRHEMNSAQLMALYQLQTATGATPWDKYLLSHSSFSKDDVIDVLATSYLRERDYPQSIAWFKKAAKVSPIVETKWNYKTDKEITINTDPFYDYLNDWQRLDKTLPKPYTKLTLAQKLLELQTRIDTTKNAQARSKLYYQFASALYNMSYYGNAGQAVAYERSGADWNMGQYKLPWEKEYYGVYKARDLYQQAFDAATDREFKAACLFMVAKCAQRQLVQPSYNYNQEKQWEKSDSIYRLKFRNNALFPKFIKEFGNTRFYSYVYNRCSYLRDFARTHR